jgi:hypothetical protein
LKATLLNRSGHACALIDWGYRTRAPHASKLYRVEDKNALALMMLHVDDGKTLFVELFGIFDVYVLSMLRISPILGIP